ncbi:TVP38/TMEM64 family protein [Clostridium fermenticellae]|uniref:TVP38/TMEM64 family membrane protein n=1 Tax=Clostridium fermenticellae TaxID=2068654 RepID=A0A386H1E7_9CLOT|nr:TVP38/TMEM64 family protein [Clostridium fermenticellae]AYD39486.1 TVP38/TMEM64 family protein [Clostridium fermenticellae]
MMKKLYEKIIKYKTYIGLFMLIVLIVYSGYEYYNKYFYIFKDPIKIKNIIMSYGKYSIIAFIVLQIIQVVVFFIPGEIVQISGGYIYGTTLGTVISFLGITIGTIAVYGISYFCGRPLVHKIVSKKDFKHFNRLLNLKNKKLIVFLLYLIPGIPKDILGYICGISEINIKDFIIYSSLGRIPGIVISAYFGSKMYSKNYTLMAFIAIIMTLLFIVGVFKGEKIVGKLTKK